MSGRVVFALPGNEALAARLAAALAAPLGAMEARRFPDGESYLRLLSPVRNRQVVLACTLDRPDDKILPLLFAAETAADLGAASVGLAAPYLAYMRQDRAFAPGEAVTSRSAAELLSRAFDWLVTVDPHLHRRHSLDEIYAIPTKTVSAAPLLSAWVRAQVENPILIGPDRESEQWVSAVAQDAQAPFMVLDKVRQGDRDVHIRLCEPEQLAGHTPVLLDDIISSGATMLEALRLIGDRAAAQCVCLAVHGIFAQGSDTALAAAGARLVTTNTIRHATNAIDVIPLLARAIADL